MGEGELTKIAWVGNEYEAAMVQALLEERGIPSLQQQVGIDGGLFGYGVLTGGGSRRVLVHTGRAEEARAVLAEARADDEQATPEPVNARYLADAQGGHKPRSYGPVGGYARIYLVSFGALALAFGVFMLSRAL